MRPHQMVALAVAVVCGCSSPPRPAPAQPPQRVLSAPATDPQSARQPAPPPVTVSKQLLAWALLGDGAELLGAAERMGLVAPELGGREALALKVMIARALGLDARVGAAIDTGRPTALGLVDPSLLSPAGSLPLVALVPVYGEVEFEAVLAQARVPYFRHGQRFDIRGERGLLHVVVADRYARVAWQADRVEGEDPVAGSLAAVLGRAGESALLVHVDAERLYANHGAELHAVLARFEGTTQGDADPELRYAMRTARRMIRFADSLRAVELLVGADDTGVTVTARADGKSKSVWADYVAAQKPGPVWGLDLLPRDAVLVYATHRSAASAEEDADDAVAYVGDAADPPATEARRGAWRASLGRALPELDGAMVYAMWAGSDGGVGMGGAYRVHSGGSARRDVLDWYRRMGRDLGGVVAHAIHLDARRFPLSVHVHPGVAHIAGHPVDAVEVSVRWPKHGTAEERLFRTLFGARLELATTFVGEQALFAVGHDAHARLASMIESAAGRGSSSLADDPRFREALAFHDGARVSLSYLSTARMAGFVDRLLAASRPDGGRAQRHGTGAHEPLALLAGDSAIVAATSAEGLRYELATRLPTAALAGVPHLGVTLWRMALAPLLNPPSLPPLPIPPAQVTPLLPAPANQAPEEDADVPRRRL